MHFPNIKARWTETKGFIHEKPDTGDEYIFLYYHTPVTIWFGDTPTQAPAGSLLIYDKHSHQRFSSPDCPLNHDWFHVRGEIEPIMRECGLCFNTLYYLPHAEYITEIISQIEIEWMIRDDFYETLDELLLHELFVRIGRDVNHKDRPAIKDKVLGQLIEARRRIHSNYVHDWSVDEMAALIPISPSQFYSLYKRAFRISPKQDLRQARLFHAKNLLAMKQYSVREVAEMTGYASLYHFIRAFKQATGVTPSQYNH